MQKPMTLIAVLLAALAAFTIGTATTMAGPPTQDQLENAGWFCFDPGPDFGIHCLDPGHELGSGQSLPLMVFADDGGQIFAGTEILLSSDIYAGQPCPQEGMDTYADLSGGGLDYFACHHPKGGPGAY